jgi:multidrug resistance efflux pump
MALFDAITDDMNDDSYSSISIAPEVNEILIGKGEEGPQMLSVEGEIQALTNENAMQMAKIARSKADEEVALVQAEEDIKMKAAEERIALLEKRTRDAEEAIRLDRARLDEVMEEKDRLVAESELTEKKLVDEMNLAVEAVTKDERDRSNMEIEQLRDEYNMSSETKTERIQLLRSSLRTANERRRRLEKERDVAKRNAEMAEIRVDRRYADEMNSLKLSLSERESEIRKMEALVKDNDGIIKDEREKLLAEIMWVLPYILAINACYPFIFDHHQLIRFSLSATH